MSQRPEIFCQRGKFQAIYKLLCIIELICLLLKRNKVLTVSWNKNEIQGFIKVWVLYLLRDHNLEWLLIDLLYSISFLITSLSLSLSISLIIKGNQPSLHIGKVGFHENLAISQGRQLRKKTFMETSNNHLLKFYSDIQVFVFWLDNLLALWP